MNDDIVLMSLIFVSLMVPFTVGYILISYIKSLENKKCICSEDPRRKYIKYYGYSFIAFALLGILTLILYIKYPIMRKFKMVLRCIILIIHFLAAYVIYNYSNMLEDDKCECSYSWKRVFLKYYGYLVILFIGLLFFCLLMALLILLSSGDTKFVLELQKILIGCNN